MGRLKVVFAGEVHGNQGDRKKMTGSGVRMFLSQYNFWIRTVTAFQEMKDEEHPVGVDQEEIKKIRPVGPLFVDQYTPIGGEKTGHGIKKYN